jgi:hypothetical protein
LLIFRNIFPGVFWWRSLIKIRGGENSDLAGGKNDFFLSLPLDAVVDGPILVGIQGYGPGKKARRQQLKR